MPAFFLKTLASLILETEHTNKIKSQSWRKKKLGMVFNWEGNGYISCHIWPGDEYPLFIFFILKSSISFMGQYIFLPVGFKNYILESGADLLKKF